MPTTIINGQTFSFTVAETLEFAGVKAAKLAAPVIVAEMPNNSTEKVENIVRETVKHRNSSSGKVVSRCADHAGKRGRVGNCPNCVREAASAAKNAPEMVSVATEQVVIDKDAWKTEKASDKQVKRIVSKANSAMKQGLISASKTKRFIDAANKVNGDQASALNRSLNTILGIENH